MGRQSEGSRIEPPLQREYYRCSALRWKYGNFRYYFEMTGLHFCGSTENITIKC